jgi:hypothetical protein
LVSKKSNNKYLGREGVHHKMAQWSSHTNYKETLKMKKKGKLEIPIDHPFPYSGFDSQARIKKSVKESGGLNSNI